MEANTKTGIKFAGASASGPQKDYAMTETQTKPRTRKAPAKTAEPEVINHDTGETSDERRRLTHTATGRSGQVTTRTSTTKMTHAVDVKRPGKPTYVEGVVTKFFATEAAAQKFAQAINSGEMAQKNDWYAEAHDAIVVNVEEVK